MNELNAIIENFDGILDVSNENIGLYEVYMDDDRVLSLKDYDDKVSVIVTDESSGTTRCEMFENDEILLDNVKAFVNK